MLPWVGLQHVIVLVPHRTHLLFNLFVGNILFDPFCLFMICTLARKFEYSFGRSPIYSAIGVQAHSSYILPLIFRWFHRKVDDIWDNQISHIHL